MATGGEEAGNWWGSWVQAAKEKSTEALQQMHKDLSEFTTTIQRDTSTAVASSATVIKDSLQTEKSTPCTSTTSKVKEGFSNLLSGISDSLAPKDYGREDSPPLPRKNRQAHIFDQAKARLHAIQTEPGTYCNEPNGPLDHYHQWQETFDLDDRKGEISDLLVSNTDVRALFTKLVPAAVSHSDFWSRYFYKLHQLDLDEARRAALKERAEMTSSQTFKEEDLGWGDDEDESWDTMPDAKQAATTQQATEAISDTENQSDSPRVIPDQPRLIDNDSDDKTTSEARLPNLPATTPDEQNISREKGVDAGSEEDDKTGIDLESDLMSGQSMDREEGSTQAADSQTLSQEGITPDTHIVDEPCATPVEKPEESVSVKALEELKVSTDHKEEVATESLSPVGSESSSANKELSSLSDDWEKDFDDIEVTEDDIAAAAAIVASKSPDDPEGDDPDDDWENWD